MIEYGLELNSNIEVKEIDGFKIYIVNQNNLIAIFDNNINDQNKSLSKDLLEYIITLNPLYIVFKESLFKNNSDKINTFLFFREKYLNIDIKNMIKVI